MTSQVSHVLHHGYAALETLVELPFHDRPEAGRGRHGCALLELDSRPKVTQEAQRGLNGKV
eukprot:9600193-Alexandrium_andersonii.AAC.1